MIGKRKKEEKRDKRIEKEKRKREKSGEKGYDREIQALRTGYPVCRCYQFYLRTKGLEDMQTI